jgi:tetratricopeptide (TPR) repeat protein
VLTVSSTRALWCVPVILAAANADADEASKKAAYELNKQSAERYREGKFSEAAELLRKAYAIDPDPTLLYNLGRACEGMGDDACAVDAYERYLTAANPPDRGAIEKKIATMKERMQKPKPVVVVPPLPPPAERSPSVLPWITTGAGVATFGAGVTFALIARAKHNEAVDDPEQASAARTQSSAESTMRTANLLLVVGGVVATTGIVWLVLDRPSRTSVAIAPTSVWVKVSF